MQAILGSKPVQPARPTVPQPQVRRASDADADPRQAAASLSSHAHRAPPHPVAHFRHLGSIRTRIFCIYRREPSDGRMVALAYPSVAHAASNIDHVDTSEAAAIRSHIGIRRVGRSRANNKIVVSDGGNYTGWPRKKITESVDRQNRIILAVPSD